MHYLCVQTLWWRDHWKQFCFAPVWLIKSCMWWNIGICSSDSKTEKKNRWPWPLHYVCRKMWQCGYTDLLELPVWSSRCWKLHGFIIISTYVQFRLFKVLLKNDTDQTSFQSRSPEFLLQILTDLWQHLFEKEFLKLLVFSPKSSAPLMHSVQQRWFQTAMLYLIWCR